MLLFDGDFGLFDIGNSARERAYECEMRLRSLFGRIDLLNQKVTRIPSIMGRLVLVDIDGEIVSCRIWNKNIQWVAKIYIHIV